METRLQARTVLFVAAAGPRRGFGHLVRCGVLAEALGVRRRVVLRGATAATAEAARRLRWEIVPAARAFERLRPDLVVVDDPAPAWRSRWVRRSRRRQVPVAVVLDGAPAPVPGADLVIDGSVTARPAARDERLAGPAFAILDPAIADGRERDNTPRRRRRVLVALGGGAHVRRLGARIADAIVRRAPGTQVDIAAGFLGGAQAPLPEGCRWVFAPRGLAARLATASVAVVAGGLTAYEAAALGTPMVALPVVVGQRPALRTFASAGAAVACEPGRPDAIASAVVALLTDAPAAQALSRAARMLVDGNGTGRVAARLRRLLSFSNRGGVVRAA